MESDGGLPLTRGQLDIWLAQEAGLAGTEWQLGLLGRIAGRVDRDLLREAIRQVADAEIMPRFQALADHEIIEKRPGDLVTVADRLAERALTDIFRREDPGCLVVGEEGMYADSTPLRQLPTAELAWVIDPVDGTRNFAGGSPDFAVMVAEVRSGVTTRSWIWQPVPEVMFFAELGGGVYRNGERLAVAAPSEPLVGALHGRWGPYQLVFPRVRVSASKARPMKHRM